MSGKPRIISGIVRDSKGQPVGDARVYFIGGPVPLPDVAVLTDKTGRFTLSAPTTGAYTIQCAAEGFATATVTVNVTSTQDMQVVIRLKK